jgi:hypothetical protein
VIDGQRLTVGRENDGTESSKNDVVTRSYSGVRVLETAYYHGVTPDFLSLLAASQKAELRLPGERSSFTREFDSKAKDRLRRFVMAVVPQAERVASSP